MAETQTTKKGGTALLGVVALAAGIATGGVGSAVINQPETTIVAAEQIDAKEEMQIAMGTMVTNLQGAGMYAEGMGAHMHLTWNASPAAKSYNIYVNGEKAANTVAVPGTTARFMLTKDMKAGTKYSVAASVIDEDGNESALSEAIEVTIPTK